MFLGSRLSRMKPEDYEKASLLYCAQVAVCLYPGPPGALRTGWSSFQEGAAHVCSPKHAANHLQPRPCCWPVSDDSARLAPLSGRDDAEEHGRGRYTQLSL